MQAMQVQVGASASSAWSSRAMADFRPLRTSCTGERGGRAVLSPMRACVADFRPLRTSCIQQKGSSHPLTGWLGFRVESSHPLMGEWGPIIQGLV